MIRKFKVLGLSAVAVLAVSAVAATAAQANFTASSYPASGKAVSTADEFKAFGSTVKCTNNTFTGTLTESSPELTINPSYNNCKFGTFPATVNFTSCSYLFTDAAGSPDPVHVVCNPGDTIDISVYASAAAHAANTPICILHVGAQSLTGVEYANEPAGSVTVSGTVENIAATQERKSAVCPSGTSTTTAQYIIQPEGIVVSAEGASVDVG